MASLSSLNWPDAPQRVAAFSGIRFKRKRRLERELTIWYPTVKGHDRSRKDFPTGSSAYQMPAGTSHGPATIQIMRAGKLVAEGSAQVSGVAPGIFAANADGKGVPTCNVLRVRADGSLKYEDGFCFDASQGKLVAAPIDLGPETDIVFLVLYGTGFRFRDAKHAVGATVGNVNTQVDYAGVAPGYEGVDQMNIKLPRALIGRGNVELNLLIEGLRPNLVTVNFK